MLKSFARLKPDPPSPAAAPRDYSPAFLAARAERDAAKRIWDDLLDEDARLELAAIWHRTFEHDQKSDRLTQLREKIAAAYPAGDLPRQHRIPAMRQELADRIERAQPAWIEAQLAYAEACTRETDRIAIELQSEHRRSVALVASSLESLSLGMMAEREVRQELAERAPLPVSAFLPDCSPAIGGLDDYGSQANQFLRRARQLKVIK